VRIFCETFRCCLATSISGSRFDHRNNPTFFSESTCGIALCPAVHFEQFGSHVSEFLPRVGVSHSRIGVYGSGLPKARDAIDKFEVALKGLFLLLQFGPALLVR
jgi:hypothetical protein